MKIKRLMTISFGLCSAFSSSIFIGSRRRKIFSELMRLVT